MAKKSNVYTRTGDEGMTSLVGGRRVRKDNARLEAYGTLDELNSFVGLLTTYVTDEKDRERLLQVQCDLFSLGSQLATDPQDKPRPCSVTEEVVSEMERAIDEADAWTVRANESNESLLSNCRVQPKLSEATGGWRGFVLPCGSQGAAVAHVCRTVCRRLERRMYVVDGREALSPQLFRYVNRLSDYLFVLAKKINASEGVEEKYWQKRS